MESAKFKIVLHSGNDLKDVKHLGTMDPYAEIWIAGDGKETKQITNIAKKGATDPVWEFPVDFGNVLMNKDYTLFVKIKHGGKMFDREIGVIQVPFSDLLAGDASGEKVNYWVTIPCGEKQGKIILSHKFSDIAAISSDDEDGSSSDDSNIAGNSPNKKKRRSKRKMAKKVVSRMATGITEIGATLAVGVAIDKLSSFGDED